VFKNRKNYDSKFKAKPALEAVIGEKTISQLSSDYGVHPNQIGMWKKNFLQVCL
jgi:putative transposase